MPCFRKLPFVVLYCSVKLAAGTVGLGLSGRRGKERENVNA